MKEEEIIKISGLKEALKLLEERVIQRVEFDMDVKGVGRYKGRMYKGQQNLILIGLEKVQKNEYKLDEEKRNE
ncbi:MAG: hypothetical protein N2V72_00345 [Methanophagales archaeon]|nr:hypothetical protein [Methanophagales archaeon]